MQQLRPIQVVLTLIAIFALGRLASCGAGIGGGDFVIPSFNRYDSVAVADLNGDGGLDIVACCRPRPIPKGGIYEC